MLLPQLRKLGISSVMVEGGAKVITDFLTLQLVDQMVVTVSPQVVGGINAVTPCVPRLRSRVRHKLVNVQYHSFGGDLVIYADVENVRLNHRS